jgi:hypothetical protein
MFQRASGWSTGEAGNASGWSKANDKLWAREGARLKKARRKKQNVRKKSGKKRPESYYNGQ